MISAAVSHDLLQERILAREISERGELLRQPLERGRCRGVAARGTSATTRSGFVAQVVALAFGLAAASLFPAILLGIFSACA